jgi:TonB family protein
MNVVDQLERDFRLNIETGVAGVLLGRIVRGRKHTLIVEDYESSPSLMQVDTTHSALGNRGSLEEIVDRWHSRTKKRISLLGFYRSCPRGQVSLNSDDIEVSNALSTEPERIVLLIEPHAKDGPRGILYLVANGAVAWKWQSVWFNRKHLAEDEPGYRTPTPESKAPRSQKVKVLDKPGSGPRPQKQVRASRSARWGLGIGAGLIMAAAGIVSMRGTQLFHAVSGSFKSFEDTRALGLKLQRAGNDWQLSWDRTAPFLLKATAGHLSITDGFIHKNVYLDINELRSGSIMYTPITDDVMLHLEVLGPESVTLASETVRIVAGLLPSSPDPMQAVASEGRLRADRQSSSTFTAPAGVLSSGAVEKSAGSPANTSSPPASAKIPLTMTPPVTPSRRDIGNVAASVPLPNPDLPLQGTDRLAPSSLPPAPPEDTNARRITWNIPYPTASVSQTAMPTQKGKEKPAILIARREPVYPEFAKKTGVTGTVELQFRVSASGKIEDIRVLKGPSALAQAAVLAVQEWRYIPAQVNGISTDSDVTTNITFKLN